MSQHIKFSRVRITSGHPMKLQGVTNYQTKLPELDKKTGIQKQECYFQVAKPKNDPEVQNIFAQMEQVAGRAMSIDPTTGLKTPMPIPVVQVAGQPAMMPPPFSWKVTDGDSQIIDKETNQYKMRPEHCQGQWLFTIKAPGWVPNCVYQPAPGQPHLDMTDASQVKAGDYIDLVVNAKSNEVAGDQAGIYLNPHGVRFNEVGGVIAGAGFSSAEADAMFAGSPAHAPAPVMQPQPQPMVQPQSQMQPQPQVQVQPQPQVQVQPQPQVQVQPVQQPAPNYDPNFAAGPNANGAG